MFPETFSNSTSLSEEVSAGSSHGNNNTTTRLQDLSPILFSSSSTDHHHEQHQQQSEETTTKTRKKRNLPGNPDPNAEVVALSPTTLMATNRFVCEVCNKGFQRDQNLQLHRRGHNLPWKLKQKSNTDVVRKKVYVCPEVSCIHHHPSRALGDLTGIKKHFSRKHGEKKWKCEKCSKKYAVQSDWKAHSKNCGTKEYRCDCGTLFARKDSFITHRAFCDALAEESARLVSSSASDLNNFSTSTQMTPLLHHYNNEPLSLQTHSSLHFQHQQSNNTQSALSYQFTGQHHQNFSNPTPISIITSSSSWADHPSPTSDHPVKLENQHNNQILIPTSISSFYQESPPLPSPNTTTAAAAAISDQQKSLFTPNFLRHFSDNMVSNSNTSTSYMSATALLQKAANVGAGPIGGPTMQTQSVGHMSGSSMSQMGKTCLSSSPSEEFLGFATSNSANQSTWQKKDFRLTRDFLGLAPADHNSVTNVLDVNEMNQMNGNVNVRKSDLLSYTGGVDFGAYERGFAAGAWRNC
ncbi:hypothetical protein C5167_046839 [Papaver somniferum]|uniref:C2H2-type domain-containing protein n=1 Tax=Papaver somniferum TaxID=3469 RepID=A0A4Y7LHC1_PAPSO|nr:protein indeterminate-domain 2-like [Papaver somniferum]RZC84050.1 hypothetical protein C5167_046839 [Papaver somniferum]